MNRSSNKVGSFLYIATFLKLDPISVLTKALQSVIESINWIFDNTIGKLLDLEIVREKFAQFAQEIEKLSGIEELEKRITAVFGEPLDKIVASLGQFADEANITAIYQKLENVSIVMKRGADAILKADRAW